MNKTQTNEYQITTVTNKTDVDVCSKFFYETSSDNTFCWITKRGYKLWVNTNNGN